MGRTSVGVRTSQYSLILNGPWDHELYDLVADPLQERNVYTSPAYAEARAQLREVLFQMQDCGGDACQVRLPPDLAGGTDDRRRADPALLAHPRGHLRLRSRAARCLQRLLSRSPHAPPQPSSPGRRGEETRHERPEIRPHAVRPLRPPRCSPCWCPRPPTPSCTARTTRVGHLNVGSFLIEVTPPGGETYLSQLCTGTLVSPRTVVLTAGHCMETQEFPEGYGTTIWFTLDEVIDADGDWTIDPGRDQAPRHSRACTRSTSGRPTTATTSAPSCCPRPSPE